MQGFENLPKNPTSKEEDTRKKFRIAVVDNSSQVESAARDAADSKLTASEKESNAQGWKGKLKNIWQNNLAKPYYLQKETALAKKRISESGNVYINEGGREEDHAKERLATTERFLSEYDKTIHREAGEDRDILGKNEGEIAIQTKIKDLVMDYAEGKLTEEAFMEEKGRVFNELKDAKKDIITKGLMYSDNVLEIAKQIKQSMDHGESIDRLDLDFEVVVGRAKSGARTEAQYNSIDKLTAMVMDSKVGSLVNETTVASALSIVFAAGSVASKGLLNRNVAAVATFGGTALVGGGIAALRERKMLEDDRKQHFREMAQGKKFENSKSPRRQEMEKYRYDSRDANTLYQNLDQSLYVYDEDGKQDLKQDMSVTELQVAFGQLAEMAARIDLSDGKKIDLVGYSDVKSIEQERLMLDIARGKAECDLMKCANSPAMQQVLNGKTVDEFLSSLTETRKRQLIEGDGGIEKQNSLFKDFKTKATGKAFVKGVVTGLVVGAAVQELISFINPHQTGLVENFLTRDANGAVDANGVAVPEHYTPLEGARRWVMDKFTGTEFPRMDMQNSHEAIIGATHAKLPQGVDIVPNNHGSFTLMQDGEIINDKITVDGNGNMTQEAINRLHHQGIEIKSTGGVQSPQEYVQNNPDSTTHIHRDLWYDNNTPKPLFDKNELKLHWGGQGGSGIDSDGNYVFNVKHMMPDGSFHGEFSVDAQEAMKNGELRMVFSLSADSQSHVFNVSIDANGNAIIPADSEMGKMMFDNAGGHAEFLGKYAEVIQDMGASDEGIEHVRVLATHVGDGVDSVGAPMAVFEMPAPYEIDSPWLIPAVDRTPLERTKEVHPYLDGYFAEDRRNVQFYRERRSPRLENSNAKLDQFKEVNEYLNKQNSEWKQKLNELNSQINEPMSEKCRVSVCIPAAGHQEGNNIFNTLNQYKNQKDSKGNAIDPALFEILVFVNHPKDTDPDETLNEVRRFQRENPEMVARVVYDKLDRKDAKIGGIRKKVTDLALLRHSERGANTQDLIIASNDADCKGMSEYYISNFLDEFKKHENVDALLGKIDWENEAYSKSPLLHMGTRFFQYLDAAYRHHKDKIEKGVGSSGANFAMKGSIYAAVGGYIEDDTIAEDKHLGTMIKSARRGASVYPIEYAGAKSYIYTSARRAVDALQKGLSPAEQWGTDFGPDNELRKLDWNIDESEKDLDSEQYQNKLRDGLERFINRTLKLYELEPQSWVASKAMRFMGVKYRVERREGGNAIVLTDISKLVKGLKKYKK